MFLNPALKNYIINPNRKTENIKWIFLDTDWWTDCDDCGAVRILRHFENNDTVRVAGVAINAVQDNSVPSLEALFQSDGNTGLAYGVDHMATDYNGTPPFQATMAANNPSENYDNSAQAEEAVRTYRRALSAVPGKLEIFSIGYLNALENLFKSPPDDISPLNGIELLTAKCSKIWIMGGEYPSGSENNFTRTVRSRLAAAYVCANNPVPLYFAGYSIGATVTSGENLKTVMPTDILTIAYDEHGSENGRPSWDPMLIEMACIDDFTESGYTVTQGNNVVNTSNGSNAFTAGAGTHYYVTKTLQNSEYASRLNAILDVKPAAFSKAKLIQPAYSNDYIYGWEAADLSLSNEALVEIWPETHGKGHDFKATGTQRPTFYTNIGNLPAVKFDGANTLMLTDYFVPIYRNQTTYAKIYFSALPTSNQTIYAMDLPTITRLFHIKVTASEIQVARWRDYSENATVDAYNARPSLNTWAIITAKWVNNSIEIYLNGTGNGATAVPGIGTVKMTKASLGVRYNDGTISEAFNGYINQIRVYKSAHDSSAMAAVIAEMNS